MGGGGGCAQIAMQCVDKCLPSGRQAKEEVLPVVLTVSAGLALTLLWLNIKTRGKCYIEPCEEGGPRLATRKAARVIGRHS